MLEMLRNVIRRAEDNEGATAVEYGIMVALIAVVIIAAVFLIGQELNSDFSCVGSALSNANNAGTVNC